jgi:hypothetical protein
MKGPLFAPPNILSPSLVYFLFQKEINKR